MKELCVVLPSYNVANILEKSVNRVRKVLNKARLDYEIILAEDGSSDNTYEVAKKVAKKYKNVKLIHHEGRLGRGRAVSNAFKKTKATVVGFIDTDLEVPPKYIPKLFEEIVDNGFDVATGCRTYKFEWRNAHRILMSRTYSLLVRILLNVNLKDTETGYKFFNRKSILPILDEIKAVHWFWDTEVMVRPYYRGLKIKEVPVVYTKQWESKTKVNIIQDTVDQLKQLIEFRKEVKK